LHDGSVLVQSGTQDLGTGTYTIMTQVAAATLGLPSERIRFELGDTILPRAPVSGGSMTAASVGPAVQNACLALRDKILSLASHAVSSPLQGFDMSTLTLDGGFAKTLDGRLQLSLSDLMQGQPAAVAADGEAKPGDEVKKTASRSFGAVFA